MGSVRIWVLPLKLYQGVYRRVIISDIVLEQSHASMSCRRGRKPTKGLGTNDVFETFWALFFCCDLLIMPITFQPGGIVK